ncbi:MAG: lipoprotein-releasing ABC transporter permease subunit [Porticoccaceae bacterium]
MIANLPLFIGLRYVFSKSREGFVSFVSLFSFCAMALGVMTLIVVLSVMNGFDQEIKTRMLTVIPHVTVTRPEGVRDWAALGKALASHPGVVAAMPFVDGPAMLTQGNRFEAISLQSLDPASPQAIDALSRHMLAGDLNGLRANSYGVVLGKFLAEKLEVQVGDTLLLTLPEVSATPAGVFPRVKRLHVAGVFQAGAQVDSGVAFVHIADAGRLLRMGDRVRGIRLVLAEPLTLSGIGQIRADFSAQYEVITWQDSLSTLFRAIRMEKTVVGLLLAVIIGVAAFNIIASLVLMVNDKRKDIAVLRTLGARAATVAQIFRIQGGAIGVAGVVVGAALGCWLALNVGAVVAWIERLFGVYLFDPTLYFITRLPSQLQWQDVLMVCALGVVLSLLSTLYPAWRGGQVQPAEALRYDH